MPALPGFSLYGDKGLGSVELLSGRGIMASDVDELLDAQDDGNERVLANAIRKALEVTRDG